jgi:ubiquinone/menaquinone biosynthesis C-methylase UbiE
MQRTPEPELMDLPEEAEAYANSDSSHILQSFADRLFEFVGDREHLNVVDLGTGPGSIPILIAKAKPTWQITAVDNADAMLAIARTDVDAAKLGDRVKLHQADVKTSGLSAHSFDLVICSSVLHHMPEPLPLWREMKRLVKPSGQIFVRDLRRPASIHDVQQIVYSYAGDEPEVLQQAYHRSLLAAFTVDEVRQQLKATGLASLAVQEVSDRYLDVFGSVPATS